MVTVTCGDGFDATGQPKTGQERKRGVSVPSDAVDVTIENVKKLIMRAIEEYRNDRDNTGVQITTIT